jgi:LmbE family N-acetylglucosaminyl deacetylase
MNIMAVFAHPDDEIGCIGTLKKHAERGDRVMLVWTTLGELASQFGDSSFEEVTRIRREHGAWVADQVGAEHHFFEIGDSRMTGDRTEALALARLYARFRPNAVITWSDDHPHPDHRMTAKIAYDAVTLARIPKILNEGQAERIEPWREPIRFYQYYADASPYPEVFVDISGTIDTSAAVMHYYQQFYGWKATQESYREARGRVGEMSGVKFAERFNVRSAHGRAVAFLD